VKNEGGPYKMRNGREGGRRRQEALTMEDNRGFTEEVGGRNGPVGENFTRAVTREEEKKSGEMKEGGTGTVYHKKNKAAVGIAGTGV